MQPTRFYRHLLVLAAVLGVMGLGLSLQGNGGGAWSNASAAAGDHLQIAPGGSQNFGSSADGAWVMANAAPGSTTTGTVELRSVGSFTLQNTSLHLTALNVGGGGQALLQYVLVTQMSFGGANLLPVYGPCTVGGSLSLAGVVACAGATLPVPPAGAGASFAMTLQVDPAAGNAAQNISGLSLQFFFTLTDTTPDPTPTPTATPFQFNPIPPISTGTAATSTATTATTATATTTATASPTNTTGGQGISGTGTIVVRHAAPAPLADNAFTLSVSGTNGVSGPGPEQRASAITVGQTRTVSVVGPETVNQGSVTGVVNVDRVACISDKRGPVDVPQAKSVQVTLVQAGETVTCTFQSSIAAGARTAGPTPIAPSTGTGQEPFAGGSDTGRWLIAGAALLAMAWAAAVITAAARSKGRSS